MGDASRIEQDGWTLEVTRSWASAGLEPVAAAGARGAGTPLVDVLPQDPDHDGRLHVAVTAPGETQPSLLVSLGYMAAGGFGADALVVPETACVFVAGGTRVICYQHAGGRWWRQWEHEVDGGAWGLTRHGDMVLASAELELAAWTLEGERRWAVAVEPPWGYTVDGDTVTVDVMGRMTTLDLRTGGAAEAGRMLGRLAGTAVDVLPVRLWALGNLYAVFGHSLHLCVRDGLRTVEWDGVEVAAGRRGLGGAHEVPPDRVTQALMRADLGGLGIGLALVMVGLAGLALASRGRAAGRRR